MGNSLRCISLRTILERVKTRRKYKPFEFHTRPSSSLSVTTTAPYCDADEEIEFSTSSLPNVKRQALFLFDAKPLSELSDVDFVANYPFYVSVLHYHKYDENKIVYRATSEMNLGGMVALNEFYLDVDDASNNKGGEGVKQQEQYIEERYNEIKKRWDVECEL